MFEYEIYINDKLYDIASDYYKTLEIIRNIIEKNPNSIGYLIEIEVKDK